MKLCPCCYRIISGKLSKTRMPLVTYVSCTIYHLLAGGCPSTLNGKKKIIHSLENFLRKVSIKSVRPCSPHRPVEQRFLQLLEGQSLVIGWWSQEPGRAGHTAARFCLHAGCQWKWGSQFLGWHHLLCSVLQSQADLSQTPARPIPHTTSHKKSWERSHSSYGLFWRRPVDHSPSVSYSSLEQ